MAAGGVLCDPDHGHVGPAQLPRGLEEAIARFDGRILAVDDDRFPLSEPLQTEGNRRHASLIVQPRIVGFQQQFLHGLGQGLELLVNPGKFFSPGRPMHGL